MQNEWPHNIVNVKIIRSLWIEPNLPDRVQLYVYVKVDWVDRQMFEKLQTDNTKDGDYLIYTV